MEHNIELGLADLKNLLIVIDVCVKRGAFEPHEISTVGGLRDKLAAFVSAQVAEEAPAVEAPVTHEAAE